MERKTDLRVIKTKKRIKEVFLELSAKKEIKKITVTEIAKTAEINKGTFYLHYKDIYELYAEVMKDKVYATAETFGYYQEFFDAPDQFVIHFFEFADDHFLRPDDNDFCSNSMPGVSITTMIADSFREKIYTLGRISQNPVNDTKLDYIIFTLMYFLSDDHLEKDTKTAAELTTGVIRLSFPKVIR